MKTSVIHIRDMLSVLSVDGVEKRIGQVGGVQSVTVNYAAGNATVRYDETRLEIADIKADVRQNGYDEGDAPATKSSATHGHDAQAAPTAKPDTAPKTPSVAKDAASANPSSSPSLDPAQPGAEPPASATPPSPASVAEPASATPS
jgi:Cu2+-exporting ATPase